MAISRLVLALAAGMLLLGRAGEGFAADTASARKKPGPTKKAAAAEPRPAILEGEDVRGFRSFCDSWMQKLAERNTHNTAHIAWTKNGSGVVGEYVAYGTERTCTAREEPGKDPIGKITYREIRYRKEGPTEAEALAAAGRIVEQTDVTEIFRYAKGRWQY